MAITAVDAILAAVLAALRSGAAIADVIAEDVELDIVPETAQSAIIVSLDRASSKPIVLSGAPLYWSAMLRLDCQCRRDNRDPTTGRPSSQIHLAAHQRLMADSALNALCQVIDLVDLRPDRELRETRIGSLVAHYALDFRTDNLTLALG